MRLRTNPSCLHHSASMESSQPPPASFNALIATLSNAVQALGRGFDVTSDTRLLYCKGAPGSRLVLVEVGRARDFVIFDDGNVVLPDVPLDIDIFREQGQLETTPAYSFQQMAEYFNKKSGLSENVPLGSFNSMFSFTGSWKIDAAATKALAMNGYFMPLYKVILMNAELVLREDVRRSVPRSWDPSSLASFIENFGTHIVASVTIGGKDEIYIKQHHSSQLSASDIEKYVKDIGGQRFLNLENHSSAALFNYEDKIADPSLVNNRDMQSYPSSVPHLSGKEDVTVIFRRRGGDDLVQNHAEWKKTVPSAPDVINMTFLPIVSLLNGLPGIQYLGRAIDLYLEYKPPIEELQYFLEFQIQRVWAPAPSSIPGHQRKEPVCPSLQFSLMGPKLYISSEQEKWEVRDEMSFYSSTLKTMSMEKTGEVVAGKVDWRGRPARKGEHGGISSSLLVLAAFMFENMASVALAINLVTYFTQVMHMDIADASNAVTNYMGTSYIVSVAIAVFADIFIGRYRSFIISASTEFMGLLLLTLQAHFPKLKPPLCNIFEPTTHCPKVDGGNAVFLYISLYLVAIGSAGVKASVPVHSADQFDEKDPQEARQMSSFFNWFLLSVCLGAAISLTLVVWVQNEKGWDRGFGISTGAMFTALIVFLAGVPRYRMAIVQGTNALLGIIQVCVAAFRNRNHDLPEDPSVLYEIEMKESLEEVEFLPHRHKFRFLEKAAIRTSTTHTILPSPWKLCRVTQVENAKTILGMIPIFCSTIIMSTCLAQLQTFSIQQGATMDTRITHKFHIPPASLPIIPISFMIILIPLYDRLFVPFARRITGHSTGITHFQRIGVGLVLSCISMATAAVVEVKRKNVAKSHGMLDAIPVLQPLPINVFWLSFQFFIFGIADMFTYVGLLEFFYSEAPNALKTISTSFLWCSMSLGYFLSTILVQIVNAATKNRTKSGGWLAGNNLNTNHVNLFYWLLCVLSFINFLNYLFWAKWYKYRPRVVHDNEENGEV